MTKQEEVHEFAQRMAEEQALFLRSRYSMEPAEMIHLYSGKHIDGVTFEEAVHFIMDFNMAHATKQGVYVA